MPAFGQPQAAKGVAIASSFLTTAPKLINFEADAGEGGLRDADDREYLSIQLECASDDGGIRGEPGGPERVLEHDHRGRAGLAVLRVQRSADGRCLLQHVEIVAAHERAADALWSIATQYRRRSVRIGQHA